MPYGGSATVRIYIGHRGPNVDASGSTVNGVKKGVLVGSYSTGSVTWVQEE
ncbi:MAG: hypothetical protein FWD58_08300 [Firmicutes bacterium]|nr:hypothetical protein [Bacillota bacterium]